MLQAIYRLNDEQINSIHSSETIEGLQVKIQTSSSSEQITSNNEIVFNQNLVNEIRGYLLRTYQGSRLQFNTWSFTDPFYKLNLKRSYRKTSTLLPGLTTKKDDYIKNSCSVIKHQHLNLCIIVDDSASMNGYPALFCRSITQAINEFMSIIDKPISLISFGSQIEISMQPSFRYHEISNALSAINGDLGGTNLLEPFTLLSQWLEENEQINHLLLITDAEISDWDNLSTPVIEILSKIKITILLLNSEVPQEFSLVSHKNMSIFQINPDEPFNNAILEEIVI